MKSIIGLILSAGFAALFSFLLQVIVARYSSVEFYGFFSTFTAFILMSIPLSTFGMGHYLVKEYSIRERKKEVIEINFIITSLLCSFLGFLIILLLIYSFYTDIELFNVFLVCFIVVAYSFHEIFQSYYLGTSQRGKLMLWQPYLNFIRFMIALIFILFFNSFDLNGLIWIALGSLFFILMPIVAFERDNFKIVIGDIHLNKILSYVKGGFWFAMVGIFYVIYSQINVFYITKMVDIKIAGYFNIGYTFLMMSLLIPNTIYYKYYLPKLHFWAKNDLRALNKFYVIGGIASFTFGCVILLILYMMAEFIIINLYGEKYIDAVDIFKGVILSIPAFYLSIHFGIFSFLGNAQKYKVLVLFLVTIFSVLINYLLILYYGALGAVVGFNFVIVFMSFIYYIVNKFFVFNVFRGFK